MTLKIERAKNIEVCSNRHIQRYQKLNQNAQRNAELLIPNMSIFSVSFNLYSVVVPTIKYRELHVIQCEIFSCKSPRDIRMQAQIVHISLTLNVEPKN